MKKDSQGNVLVYILVTILVLGGLGWYLWTQIQATPADVEKNKPQIIVVPPDILQRNQDLIQKIAGFAENGSFPIQIDPATLGKSDPFVP